MTIPEFVDHMNAGLPAELWGHDFPVSVGMFLPFYTDCGKNTWVGERTFINMGCKFQDQGGIFIGNDCLIGHNATLCTINHAFSPGHRGDMTFKPIRIEDKVWLGANVTVLQAVTTCSLPSICSFMLNFTSFAIFFVYYFAGITKVLYICRNKTIYCYV